MLTFFIVVIVIIFLVRLSLYSGLTVRQYTVNTDKISSERTFALITDLHSTVYGDNQSELIEKIKKYNPEAVLFSGDIADDKRGFDGTRLLLDRLTKIYPCYYVTGNHECWVEYTDDIKKLFSNCGVTVISNKSVDLGGGITLCGIYDPLFYDEDARGESNFWHALASVEKGENYNILLSHRPEFAEKYGDYGFDLTLTGHAHGGQARIPFILNGLYAPGQGWFPKYAGGQYNFDNGSTMIVSRGLMKDDLPRIFNPPELVIVTIK